MTVRRQRRWDKGIAAARLPGNRVRLMSKQFSPEPAGEPGLPPLSGRATLGATVGNMLEFYDFITYSFFAIQIGRTFFPR